MTPTHDQHRQGRRLGAGRRGALLSTIAAGAVIVAVSGAGIFAALTDRATTGTNRVTSQDQSEGSVDLQLARGSFRVVDFTFTCGTFSDDLTTGLITEAVGEVRPGESVVGQSYLCLKNTGTDTASVTWSAIDVLDVEVACSATEASPDPTCGPRGGASNPGELAPFVAPGHGGSRCGAGVIRPATFETTIAELASAAEPLAEIQPGEVKCFNIRLALKATDDQADEIAAAQSDRLTWRFAFDASVAVP